MEFSTMLRELREDNNLTQKELAKACNLSPQCISALENGINSPNALTLSALASFFNLSIDELLGYEITPDEQAAGAVMTRKASITPIEDELLHVFRELGKKHGEEVQRALITVAEKMV